MDYTKATKAELLKEYHQNAPDMPDAIRALTELERRRDEAQLSYNRLLTVFTGLLALFTALLAYDTVIKILGQLVALFG